MPIPWSMTRTTRYRRQVSNTLLPRCCAGPPEVRKNTPARTWRARTAICASRRASGARSWTTWRRRSTSSRSRRPSGPRSWPSSRAPGARSSSPDKRRLAGRHAKINRKRIGTVETICRFPLRAWRAWVSECLGRPADNAETLWEEHMAISEDVGSIATLWRFPVKSMGGEQLQDVEVTERGVLGDRAYALIDKDTGKVVSAKSVRLFPNLLDCKAAFVEPPRRGGDLPPVQILFPDSTTVRSDSVEVDRVLSAYFERNVTLGRTAPDDFTIDQYHPDIEGADPGGNRDTVVAQKLGAALFAELGMESPVFVGSFLDVFPLSVLTTSTLTKLEGVRSQTRFDQRRFRMNLIVRTEQPGFVENGWVGHQLVLGHDARINVALLDPRCVMTTLVQEDLPQDTDVLRTLVHHNKMKVAAPGQLPCAGVYAVVAAPGTVRTGDNVTIV